MNLNYFIFKQLSCAYKTFFIPNFISFGETEVPKAQTLFLVSTSHKLAAPIISQLFSDCLYFAINKKCIDNSIFKLHSSSLDAFVYESKDVDITSDHAIKYLQKNKNLVLFINLRQNNKDIFELELAEKIITKNSKISYIPVAITGLDCVLSTNSFIPRVRPVRTIAACPAIQSQISKEQLISELSFLEKQILNKSPDYFPSIFNNV